MATDYRTGQKMSPIVTAVSCSARHTFSKDNKLTIRLIAGRGVEGDAHLGSRVRHRYDVSKKPHSSNLRQVHMIHQELLDQLQAEGFTVAPGILGENITTRGLDLPALPHATRLGLGREAVVEITGLRAPCKQMDHYQKGLVAAVMTRNAAGKRVSRAGVMAIVICSGDVQAGDQISVHLPVDRHRPLRHV
jgi:MOSC domain-containing protein YiiM